METSANRRVTVAILLAILTLALLLRVFNVGHVLSWDEAWNANSVSDAATGNTDEVSTFFPNFFRHPPSYTGLGVLFARVTGSGRAGVSIALEVISVICSLLLILVIFVCGRDWFGYGAGLGASFFFAVMPAARVYDTWVKQESMTLLFGMLFLLLFFRGKHVAAGLFLGLALLTKEIIVFAPAALVVFLAVTRRFGEYRKMAVSVGVAAALSAWWYLMFSSTSGHFAEFFLGRHESAVTWAKPWYFYLERIPADVGLVGFLAALVGIAIMARRLWLFRRVRRSQERYPPRDMALFILVWLVVLYLTLSLSYGKPPWMIYSGLPGFALLGGWGISEGLGTVSSRKRNPVAVAALVVVLAVGLTVPVSFGGYVASADVMWEEALRDKRIAERVNRDIGADATVAMRDADLSPNLAFYLECYRPGSMALLPLDPGKGEKVSGHSLLLLDDRTDLEQAYGHLEAAGPDILLLNCGSRLARRAAGYVSPRESGGTCLFDARELVEAIRSGGW